jgi:hypothetical protein
MNSLIEAWLIARQATEEATERELQAYEDAELAALPSKLRPAEERDVIEGAVLWYPHWQDKKWVIVDEVRDPSDEFKAYCSEDGCRYGLHGAFVEV